MGVYGKGPESAIILHQQMEEINVRERRLRKVLVTPVLVQVSMKHYLPQYSVIFELTNHLTNNYIIFFDFSMQPGLVGALGIDVI